MGGDGVMAGSTLSHAPPVAARRKPPRDSGRRDSSGQDVPHDPAVHVGQAEASALVLVREPFVVDAQQVEQGGVEVVDVDAVLGDLPSELVAAAVQVAAFDAGAGEKDREGARVMVPTVVIFCQRSLAVDRASEFADPDDERFFWCGK